MSSALKGYYLKVDAIEDCIAKFDIENFMDCQVRRRYPSFLFDFFSLCSSCSYFDVHQSLLYYTPTIPIQQVAERIFLLFARLNALISHPSHRGVVKEFQLRLLEVFCEVQTCKFLFCFLKCCEYSMSFILEIILERRTNNYK